MLRLISNKQATVKLDSGQFYLVEQGTIDTKLIPCNMAEEFKVKDLQVTISGYTKRAIAAGTESCCTETLVITGISR